MYFATRLRARSRVYVCARRYVLHSRALANLRRAPTFAAHFESRAQRGGSGSQAFVRRSIFSHYCVIFVRYHSCLFAKFIATSAVQLPQDDFAMVYSR